MAKKKKEIEIEEVVIDVEAIEEDDLLNSGEWEEAKKYPEVDQSKKILVGHHPITKEPVYI